jgi:leucyl aminopeptidase (aminopeptidase T)
MNFFVCSQWKEAIKKSCRIRRCSHRGDRGGDDYRRFAFCNWNYLLEEPLKITVKGGKAVEMTGDKKDYDILWKIATTDENASNIAELGIGTCHFLPREMRDTSLDFARYGTAHLALGRNNDISDNTMSRIHQDVLINKPTIIIDDQCIMQEGELLI